MTTTDITEELFEKLKTKASIDEVRELARFHAGSLVDPGPWDEVVVSDPPPGWHHDGYVAWVSLTPRVVVAILEAASAACGELEGIRIDVADTTTPLEEYFGINRLARAVSAYACQRVEELLKLRSWAPGPVYPALITAVMEAIHHTFTAVIFGMWRDGYRPEVVGAARWHIAEKVAEAARRLCQNELRRNELRRNEFAAVEIRECFDFQPPMPQL